MAATSLHRMKIETTSNNETTAVRNNIGLIKGLGAVSRGAMILLYRLFMVWWAEGIKGLSLLVTCQS